MSAYEEGYLAGLREAHRIAVLRSAEFRDQLRREGDWEGDPEPDDEERSDLEMCCFGSDTVMFAIEGEISEREGK